MRRQSPDNRVPGSLPAVFEKSMEDYADLAVSLGVATDSMRGRCRGTARGALSLWLRLLFYRPIALLLTHGFAYHVDAMGIRNQAIQN